MCPSVESLAIDLLTKVAINEAVEVGGKSESDENVPVICFTKECTVYHFEEPNSRNWLHPKLESWRKVSTDQLMKTWKMSCSCGSSRQEPWIFPFLVPFWWSKPCNLGTKKFHAATKYMIREISNYIYRHVIEITSEEGSVADEMINEWKSSQLPSLLANFILAWRNLKPRSWYCNNWEPRIFMHQIPVYKINGYRDFKLDMGLR